MPVINGKTLLAKSPIRGMASRKLKVHGRSYGLSEVGYDIRVKQDVDFIPPDPIWFTELTHGGQGNMTDSFYHELLRETFYGYTLVDGQRMLGRKALASTIEKFDMPPNLWGELRNKSTNVRQFFDATLGTDIEPGWRGWLTLEIVFHGTERLTLPAGCPIAKVVFHEIVEPIPYEDKYQDQEDEPVPARFV